MKNLVKDSEVTIVSCRASQSIKMASSNKKVLKFDNNNMDYYSDNRTTTKTTRKRKEKGSDDDSPTKRAYKKKVAKEDHDQEYPPIATQHSQGRVFARGELTRCFINSDILVVGCMFNFPHA